jgi:adenylate kinase|tara:strand:+ start:4786 stop:5379 length:594 start_codon:yes stop_codon:yes gene_type:complete
MNYVNHLGNQPLNIIGITGSPATGKKSIGKIVADSLKYKFLDLNKIALESGGVLSDGEDFEVDTDKLRKQVLRKIKGRKVVLVGHLLPFILSQDEIEFVAVLRCSPKELEARYFKRAYSNKKIKDNISSEILDICFASALRSFGPSTIAEFDTTERQPNDIAKDIRLVWSGDAKRSFGKINWLSEIFTEDLIKKYLD